ncbi:MAG: hypothetical protein IPI27_09380 [Betaproteobacteria bacterium]|nr:hypothetical protein [Betaproteobacteria bacterium]
MMQGPQFHPSDRHRAGARPIAPRRHAVAILCLALVGASCVAAHADSLSSQAIATFAEPKAGYLGTGSKYAFPLFSDGDSVSIGTIVGGVGAKASASAAVKLEGVAEAFWSPTYSFTFQSSNKVNVAWDGDLSVGESFFVSTGASPLSWGKVHLQDPGFQGHVGLRETFSGSATASGCLGGCINLDLSAKLNQAQNIFSILSKPGDVDLLVLGKKVADALPYKYTSSDNLLKLSVGAPNFAATISASGSAAPVTPTSGRLLGMMSVTLAQLVADLVGLPIPLSGNIGGFGYTLLEALVGLGLDLERWFQIAATKLYTSLTFSAPVEVRENGAWSAAKNSFTPEAGKVYEVRPVQASKTLGITPWYGLYTDVDATLDLVPFAGGGVRAMEVYGHGVNIGPLVNEPIKHNLGHVELDATNLTRSYWTTGKPMTLQFDPLVADADGVLVDLCTDPAACLVTGFLTAATALDADWQSDRIYRATNFADDCLLGLLDPLDPACGMDETFVPLRVDYRPGATRTDPVEVTPRYDQLLAILGLPDLVSGAPFDIAQLEAGLRRLGVDLDGNGLPRSAPEGAPPLTEPLVGDTSYLARIEAVPEPGALALVLAGLIGLVATPRAGPRRTPKHVAIEAVGSASDG